jgi:hypothetical protein
MRKVKSNLDFRLHSQEESYIGRLVKVSDFDKVYDADF